MTITGIDQAARVMELTDRIAELEAALDWALDHTKGPETEPTELSEILNASRSRLLGAALETQAERPCTCYCDDRPPVCQHKYALSFCRASYTAKTNVNLCKHKGCKLSAGYGGEYCDEHL